MTQAVQGYAEGYYGRLPSWQERRVLLDTLARHGQNTYYYAPKEDARHRLNWREPYDSEWRREFALFCDAARELGIRVVAGVAPGLDFDFKDLQGGPDRRLLFDKCRQLLADGADGLSLLMDDIDEDFPSRSGGMTSEGLAHARLANALADELGRSLWVTPRIYANELAASAPDYLPDFLATLYESQTVLYCGRDIVTRRADCLDIRQVAPTSAHSLVLWDNLYANDYCPQRLFVGAWSGRDHVTDCVLNPTGLLHTDCLLLDMMATTHSRGPGGDAEGVWSEVMVRHGVPEEFRAVAGYFAHPVFNGEEFHPPLPPDAATLAAIETCLWRWKTPLSREWYPFLFGLKLDLLIQQGKMSPLRIRKTQSAPLAVRLGVGGTS
ncbi:beta-N-acetylglucosaminidase domain-containing protein [Granulosicoccus sp. 3-233]|uniref:beta-N-acetylglucosaminidase domain-containing protein n=1 Tax=Granulosicoccus sp. 3-233 TaxID=3417969 RepID=UPI003D3563B9